MIRRARPPQSGRWSVPGGRLEAGETLAEAVVREVAEETGLDVVCDQLVGWVEHIGRRRHLVILDFSVTVLGPGQPVAGDDAAQAAWVPLSQLHRLPLVDGLADFLRQHAITGPDDGFTMVPRPP